MFDIFVEETYGLQLIFQQFITMYLLYLLAPKKQYFLFKC
jgi:hypothetical protein